MNVYDYNTVCCLFNGELTKVKCRENAMLDIISFTSDIVTIEKATAVRKELRRVAADLQEAIESLTQLKD